MKRAQTSMIVLALVLMASIAVAQTTPATNAQLEQGMIDMGLEIGGIKDNLLDMGTEIGNLKDAVAGAGSGDFDDQLWGKGLNYMGPSHMRVLARAEVNFYLILRGLYSNVLSKEEAMALAKQFAAVSYEEGGKRKFNNPNRIWAIANSLPEPSTTQTVGGEDFVDALRDVFGVEAGETLATTFARSEDLVQLGTRMDGVEASLQKHWTLLGKISGALPDNNGGLANVNSVDEIEFKKVASQEDLAAAIKRATERVVSEATTKAEEAAAKAVETSGFGDKFYTKPEVDGLFEARDQDIKEVRDDFKKVATGTSLALAGKNKEGLLFMIREFGEDKVRDFLPPEYVGGSGKVDDKIRDARKKSKSVARRDP